MKNILLIVLCNCTCVMVNAQCTVNILSSGPLNACGGETLTFTAMASGNVAAIDQQAAVYNSGISALSGPGYSFWQSFTAGETGTLTQIDIGFFNFINGQGTLSIYTGTGTGGTHLQSQVVNVNCPSGNCLLSFPVNAQVIAGNVYTFHFIPGIGMPNPYGVQADVPGSYAGGTHAIVDPSGTYPDWDVVFNTWVLPGYEYQWNTGDTTASISVTGSGTYGVSVTAAGGCSASATVTANFTVINTNVSINNTTLHSDQNNAAWQWLKCNQVMPTQILPGATAQDYIVTQTGSYAVEITLNGCVDTTNCQVVNIMGMAELASPELRVYPNPSHGRFTIENANGGKILITDVLGKTVFTSTMQHAQQSIDLSQQPAGLYLIKFDADNKTQYVKLILR